MINWSGRLREALGFAPRGQTSLIRKVLIIFLLGMPPFLFLGGAFVERFTLSAPMQTVDEDLSKILSVLSRSSGIYSQGYLNFELVARKMRLSSPVSAIFYWQVEHTHPGDARKVTRSFSLADLSLPPGCRQAGQRSGETVIHTWQEADGRKLRVAEQLFLSGSATDRWCFQVAHDVTTLEERVQYARQLLWGTLILLGGILIFFLVVQMTYILWPLRRVGQAVARVRSGEISRLPTSFPSEILSLVSEINWLIDHNDRQSEFARSQAENLAHALKTPMSIIASAAELNDKNLPETVFQEVRVMRGHIDRHLARARARGNISHIRDVTPVWPSLERLRATFLRLPYGHQVAINFDGDHTACFHGDRISLEDMLGNLMDNALRYGNGGVWIHVACAGDRLRIIIEDDGDGVPDEDNIRRAFERGARLDLTGPAGSGLGLAIVKEICTLSGGQVSLQKSEAHGGWAVHLNLPAAPSPGT